MKREGASFAKALTLGITASFFFAINFVLVRSMNVDGDYFLWTGCLRYFFTLPLMALLLVRGRGFKHVFASIKSKPWKWLLWSTVGFGIFYSFISIASLFGESWFTAAAWQFTIVAGVLLTPLFGKKIPAKNLACSVLIVAGIMLMQYSKFKMGVRANWPMLIITMSVAAFAYPLGNRKMMMTAAEDGLSTIERVFGMVLCSIPFWLICAGISYANSGLPSGTQCLKAFMIALFTGTVATSMFFTGTDMVKHNPRQLAVVEAAQSGEVVFTVIMAVLVLKDDMPDLMGYVGIGIIVLGMILNSIAASRDE